VLTFPGFDVTVYDIIVELPSNAGGFHDIDTLSLPGVTLVIVGGSGIVGIITGGDGLDAAELPAIFVAKTVNVYSVPGCNPDTIIDGPNPELLTLPGDEVTV
jgi:hypothetical protein